jgi:hypothetical protein
MRLSLIEIDTGEDDVVVAVERDVDEADDSFFDFFSF